VDKHPFFQHQLQRAAQHLLLNIATGRRHVFRRIAVVHMDHILFDDGPFIEIVGNEVCGSTDNFHTALERLPVGFRTDKCRQEGMVNVDDALTVVGHELRGEHTHVLGEDPAQGFFARLAAVNLFLVLFNMIPAFPMDGGRVLRAALAMPLGRVRATKVAAHAGQAIAFLFGFVGLASGNLLLLLIAVFIFFAAAAESSDVEMKDRTHNVPARDAMITSFEALAPDDTLDAAAHAVVRTTQAEFPVLDAGGHLVGVLTRSAIVTGMNRSQRTDPVSDHMTRNIPQVKLGTPLEMVVEELRRSEVPAVAVTDPRGNFLGYITRENIGEWFILGGPEQLR